eukprot:3797352-Rhodomonas_salina.1
MKQLGFDAKPSEVNKMIALADQDGASRRHLLNPQMLQTRVCFNKACGLTDDNGLLQGTEFSTLKSFALWSARKCQRKRPRWRLTADSRMCPRCANPRCNLRDIDPAHRGCPCRAMP